MNCLLCKQEITEEELSYEDYYTLHRGFTPEADKHYICFDCIEGLKAIKRLEEVKDV